MKKIILLVFLASLASTFSCDQEDPFVCDKNAVVNRVEPECAFARVERYSGTEADGESFEIGLSWSTGGLDLFLNTSPGVTERRYTKQDGASFWFNQLNRLDAANITITKIDRENRTISGIFDVAAEGNSNSQAYDYTASGSFTDVPF